VNGKLSFLFALLAAASVSAESYDCRRVEVTDSATGRLLAGIEDLVHHRPSNTLILSVHDRWGDRDGDADAPKGLFSIAADELGSGMALEAVQVAGYRHEPMRPHGMALRPDTDGHRLAVIDHRYYREEMRGDEAGTVIRDYSVADDGTLTEVRVSGHAFLCPANDLDWLDENRVVVSLDRANCSGFWRFLELARGQARGRVAVVDLAEGDKPQVVLDSLGFPNGVLLTGGRSDSLWIGQSFAERIERFKWTDAAPHPVDRMSFPGAVDNLAIDRWGRIVTAVHPDPTDFGLYTLRVWGFDSAPTLLMHCCHERGDSPGVILDDPDGEIISGATSVISVGNLYVAGAAFDNGLAVCEPK